MEAGVRYRGKQVTSEEVAFIRRVIAENPQIGRCQLSRVVCQSWNWIQANGQLRDMVCRGLLLELEKAGCISLPPRIKTPSNPFVQRRAPDHVEIEQTACVGPLSQLTPLEIHQVRGAREEGLFNGLIAQYHYLGYSQPVGEHLKYLVLAHGRPVAAMAWSSAPRHIGCRDRYLGWSAEMRRMNLRFLAYQSRFLILPWVRVAHLASHLLARMARLLAADWERIYAHPVYFLETFVDTERFAGTCYRAANWTYLGLTTGRGKNDQTHRPNRSLKAVWGYPLVEDFRERLRHG